MGLGLDDDVDEGSGVTYLAFMGKAITPPTRAKIKMTRAALDLILEQESDTGSVASKGPTPKVTAKNTIFTPVNNRAAVVDVVKMTIDRIRTGEDSVKSGLQLNWG